MNPQFSQPKGSVGKETNKDSIARKFGCKKSDVLYAKVGAVLTGYKVIYDNVTQRSYALPSNLPTGATITSLTDGILVHNTGTIDLGALAVLRGEFITVGGTFTVGGTLGVKNELMTHDDGKYRWGGTFPKIVPSGSSPETSGGISPTTWIKIYDPSLRENLVSQSGAGIVGSIDGNVQNDLSTLKTNTTKLNNHADLVIDDYLFAGEITYDNAIQRVLAASLSSGRPIKFLPNVYNFSNPVVLNMNATGIKIYGAGVSRTELRFPNAAAGVTQLIIKSTTDWYDFVWEGMSVRSSHAGILCQIGDTGFVDPLNVARLEDLAFLNSSSIGGNNVVALSLEYGVQCSLINVRANCYANGAGVNVGRALVVRQVGFTTYVSCSFGNASYGVSFLDGVSFTNNFIGCDFENINIALYNGVPTSGGHTFIGCQFSLWTNFLAQAPVGSTNRFLIINPNVSQTVGLLDPANATGIKFQNDQLDITTPGLPASGSPFTNTTGRDVVVTIGGGTVGSIIRNGVTLGITNGTVILHPMDIITLVYSAGPSWSWYKLG
ncbi:putative tailspike protein [Dickeya phage phiDP23.1]|uniref:Putative tailspike protein n=3 Tax=Aglimvirinae TaxID=2169530 RepID=A0A075E0W0_9CAUD|nr:tail spike protein [Dickeya phage RC-2014]AHZ60301.1 putative tailspike protein [Dickeya phage RC-2014]AIM51678.1 putative tailspike protein [Dickeya phage phiDP10.3]AIM51757.1 putative tailspike protein [Dickeya phage phiDP23.1]